MHEETSEAAEVSGSVWRGLAGLAGRALLGLGDLLVPPTCLGCRAALRSKHALCPACWRQVHFIQPPLCDRLGIPLTWGWGQRVISAGAAADPPSYDRARAVAHFDGVMRQLIHAFKYGDRHDGRQLFARWAQMTGADLLAEADLLVPVPLHRWRLLGRRYNQAALIAQDVARLSGVPWRPDVLRRRKNTRPQVGLSAQQRQANLAGAFFVAPSRKDVVSGRRVVLIDDVITTGATINACARVLRRAGAVRVDVLALAMVTEDSRVRS